MTAEKQCGLLGFSFQELNSVVQNFGQPSYRGRQLFDAIYRQRLDAVDKVTTLPLAFRQRLAEEGFKIEVPRIEKRFQSLDGTVRYLIAFADE